MQPAIPGHSEASTRGGLARLISPRSVAVIGASDDQNRIGGRPIFFMLAEGFKGRILPVNPNRRTVQGLDAFACVADLPETPDVAIIAIPADQAVTAIADLVKRGTRAAIVFSAGFAETGMAGKALEEQLVSTARAGGMRLVGPNSLGVFNATTGFCGSFSSICGIGATRVGPIGIASQSGAYGSHILSLAKRRSLGISQCVMTGNEADVTVGEIIGLMAEDDTTDVITAYFEGLNDPDTLLAGLGAAHRARKPVVVMKVGSSPLGSEAALSHTASLAGNDAVFDAVMAEFGVIRARSTDEMIDIARTATRRIYPVGNTLGVITVSGGAGVLISDAAHASGLAMPPMPEPVQQRLRDYLPFASALNPVDCTAQFLNDDTLIEVFGEALVTDGGYQSILGFFTYAGGTQVAARRLCTKFAPWRARYPEKLFVFSIIADTDVVEEVEQAGYVVFEDPTRAVTAITAMGHLGEAFARALPTPPPAMAPVVIPSHHLSEADAKRLLVASGIDAALEEVCADADAAVLAAERIGYPVVLKIVSPDIIHKSEIGGVLLNIASADEVCAGHAELLRRAAEKAPTARLDGILVARQLEDGVECILGIQRDPVFGPIAMVGLGGVFVEVLQDVVLRRCPFDEAEAGRMIRSLRGAAILDGARGRPRADIPALAHMLARLSQFAVAAGPALASIDLNPVMVLPIGKGAFAVDAVIERVGYATP